jgi:hypothetical protein
LKKPIKKPVRDDNRVGKIPKILAALTPEEIMEAGEKGYDENTFLISKGMIKASLRETCFTFPKWKDNYAVGRAKYLLKMKDKIYELGITDGDTQILKKLAESELGMKEQVVKDNIEVVVVGAKRGKN